MAGTETTTNLIANAVLALDAHPDQRREVAADRSLVASTLEEVLRWDAPVQALARVTTDDVTVGDVVIPSGSRVQLRFGSANRDEREFPGGEQFDIHRAATRHVGLGHGIHYCLGAALSRLEGRIMFDEMIARVPDWSVGAVERHPSLEVRGPSRLELSFATTP